MKPINVQQILERALANSAPRIKLKTFLEFSFFDSALCLFLKTCVLIR